MWFLQSVLDVKVFEQLPHKKILVVVIGGGGGGG
jgi:hypothetical protein